MALVIFKQKKTMLKLIENSKIYALFEQFFGRLTATEQEAFVDVVATIITLLILFLFFLTYKLL